MLGADDIIKSKKALKHLEKKLEHIPAGQRPAVVQLSERLKALIAEIDEIMERGKNLWNPAPATRMKLGKRGQRVSKDLLNFEMDVAHEFEIGHISEEIGKKIISVTRRIRESKNDAAKMEFAYFEEFIQSYREWEKAQEELKEEERELRREKLRIEKLFAEMAGLEKESFDSEKARKYQELLENLEKLKKTRAEYLHSLVSEPVATLLGDVEKHSLRDYSGIFPGNEGMGDLKQFFSDYPEFGKCNAEQLCEFFTYSEKKLSHICPETSRFRRVVIGNRNLFETLRSLEQGAFLEADGENEKALDFYSEKIGGAREIVARIRELKKMKNAYRDEYEKARAFEQRKEELSKYSKKDLELELKEVERLLELLNTEIPEEPLEEKRDEKPKESGGIWSLIKKAVRMP